MRSLMNLVKNKILLVLWAVLVLSSCAIKPPITSDYDTSFDFSGLRTYAWIPTQDRSNVSTLENKRQINAIETMLNRKGFSKSDCESDCVVKVDFLLKTHNVTDNKTNVDRLYRASSFHPFYSPWSHNTFTSVREYKIGTLVLDIVDPKKKQVIWRGSVSKPLGIYKNRSPEERTTIALSNAEHMLTSFPPDLLKTQ